MVMTANSDGDLKALITLRDGRTVWRDGRGRYRDAASGRFVSVPMEGEFAASWEAAETPSPKKGQEGGARARAKAHLLRAVRTLGLSADNAEDAWGRLVAVQARIALDEESGARATAAAKLVAQATGLIDDEQGQGQDEVLHIEMSEDSARALLQLIREEKHRRREIEERK